MALEDRRHELQTLHLGPTFHRMISSAPPCMPLSQELHGIVMVGVVPLHQSYAALGTPPVPGKLLSREIWLFSSIKCLVGVSISPWKIRRHLSYVPNAIHLPF